MANPQQISTRPWILEVVPLVVVFMIAAHVAALVSYREAASEKKRALEAVQFPVIEKRIFSSMDDCFRRTLYKVLIHGCLKLISYLFFSL